MMEKKSNANIEDNIKEIINEIKKTAAQSGRNAEDITLMAITKTRTLQEVNSAINAGITLLGENKVQELLSKYEDYNKNAQIHFVGHLQTNKVRQIVDKVSMIHSVDSVKLAAEIDKRCKEINKVMDILIEVNVGEEESKAGVPIDLVLPLITEISKMENISIKGLMAIPPIATDEQAEKYFSMISKLFIDISNKKLDNVNMKVMSMGMSGDYKQAIKHGSNIVRIGTGIFGERDYSKP